MDGHIILSFLFFQGNERNLRGVPSSSLHVSFLVLLRKRGREKGRPALVHPSILAFPFGEGKQREGEAVRLPISLSFLYFLLKEGDIWESAFLKPPCCLHIPLKERNEREGDARSLLSFSPSSHFSGKEGEKVGWTFPLPPSLLTFL